MKRVLLVPVFLLAAFTACPRALDTIPTGSWKYRLLVNGADIGHAVMSNTLEGDLWVSTMDMEMDAGYVRNTTRQVVTETREFSPVKLEVDTATTTEAGVTTMKTVARFNGSRVDLEIDGRKSSVNIEEPFILEGNYFMNALIRNGFKKGTIVRHRIYEPSVDIEEPILVIVKVIGREQVEIRGKKQTLTRIGYAIENLKNMDVYIDEKGVTRKSVITMLNNRLELVAE